MGQLKEHPPVKFFAGITCTDPQHPLSINKLVEEFFPKIEAHSELFDFSQFTDYYESEFGKPLYKYFLVFSGLWPAEELIRLKHLSNKLESMDQAGAKRWFNMDPGYVTLAKMVLATTKDFAHRIYLGRNIYGDVHYQFSRTSIRLQPWTYPDYQQEKIQNYFLQIRENYRRELVNLSHSALD